ncbi:hypothetical protein [Oryza sativa Japonica Group]|uniref:Uncharacterized protein n=1 Tax=Oryza sativa subsp. japonica TaxID=39947 RepID=Q5JL86_ORYSJ|nr:hypothetical protein [Oryza sativa Japonica Group]
MAARTMGKDLAVGGESWRYMSEAASSKHVMENTGYEERELIPKHLAQKNK